MSDKEKNMKEIDFNNPTADDIQSLVCRYLRSARVREDDKMVARIFSDYVNAMGHNHKNFVDEMFRDHRTLIQNKMKIAFYMIAAAAKGYKEKNYDGRNEYSFKLAAEIYVAMSKLNRKKECNILDLGLELNMVLSQEGDGEDGYYHVLNLGCPHI